MSPTGECLANLESSGTMLDITITFPGSDKSIRGHRSLLSKRSPVFEAMLNGPMAVDGKLELAQDNPDAFEWLLKHLYRGDHEFPEEMEMTTQVFCQAHKYQIDLIKDQYEKYLKEKVDKKNFPLVFNIAVILGNETLLLACEEVLVHSTDDILKSPQVGILSGPAFRLLLGHRSLVPSSEMLVSEAIAQWSKAQLEKKSALDYKALRDDLKHSLKTFTTSDLTECATRKILQALPQTEWSQCETGTSEGAEAITDKKLEDHEPIEDSVTPATKREHHNQFRQVVDNFSSRLEDMWKQNKSVMIAFFLLNATVYVLDPNDDFLPQGFYPVRDLDGHLRPYLVDGLWDQLEGQEFWKFGEGGQSAMYLSLSPWPSFPFRVVLKEYKKDSGDSRHEASFLAYLNGAGGAPKLIAYNSSTGYMLMEFVTAFDMATFKIAGLNRGTLLLTFMSLTAQLKEIHDLGVVHGDLKPNNVLVSFDVQERPTARIIDFGLSTLSGRRGGMVHRVEDWKGLLARSPWLSAEFARGKILDTRSDIPGLAYSMTIMMPRMKSECRRLYNLTRRAMSHRPEDRPSLGEFQEVLRWEFEMYLNRRVCRPDVPYFLC